LVINVNNKVNFRNVNKYLKVKIAKKTCFKKRCTERIIFVATYTPIPTPVEEEHQHQK
jgi:hypothetical protein